MHYIAVAPLAVSRRDTYTYRTSRKVPAGTVVSVPYGGSRRTGVVTGMADPDGRAKDAEPTGERLPGWQLGFGQALADAYLAPLGQTFALFLPGWREGLASEATPGTRSVELRTVTPDAWLEQPHTLVLVPERAMLRRFGAAGECFAASMPIKERRETWRKVRSGMRQPLFGTRSALFLPWKRLSRIVLLHEDELGHQNDRTPRFHAREAGRLLAEAVGAQLTLTSPAPSLRAWELSGRPDLKPAPAPQPGLVTPRYERFEDPLPYGFAERLGSLDGSVLVHTVQGKVGAVREALNAGNVAATVGGQAAALAGQRYDNVVTLGIDAILSRPGFAVTERAVALLRKLGGALKANGTFLAYSKHQDHPAFTALGKPYGTFLREELQDRESLGLPPAQPLIRVSTEKHDRPKVEKALERHGFGRRSVRFVSDGESLAVLIKGDPRRLRALISPERRISVEY